MGQAGVNAAAGAARRAEGRGSIRRRVLLGTLVVTSLAITGAGIAVDRIVRSRITESHRASLEAVLESGALRAIAESRASFRRMPDGSTREWPLLDGDSAGHLWFVRRPGAPEPMQASHAFPFDGAPITEAALERSTEPALREACGDDGVCYRVAGFTVTPADLLPPRPEGPGEGGPGGFRREGPRGGDDEGFEGRPGPPGGRGGDGYDERPGRRRRRGGPREGFSPDERYEVFVAASIVDERETFAELRRTLLLSGLGAILLSVLLITFVVQRGIAPLAKLSDQVEGLDETSLGDRIEVPSAPRELVPIVTSIDATRVRLAKAFERERRFTADAAHELRTPLAGLRATLEVALRRDRSLEAYKEYADQCLHITRSMEDTLEGLLILARSEEIAERLEPVDVADVMTRAFGAAAPELKAGRLVLRDETPTDVDPGISSVAPLVERIASNLARNAAAHATPGTEIVHAVVADGPGRVAMTVSNVCAPLPPEASEMAFEAFWRADVARTGDGEHVGLGLPLVAKAAEALGGSASIQVTDEGAERARFSIRVSLPRAVDA